MRCVGYLVCYRTEIYIGHEGFGVVVLVVSISHTHSR